MNWLMMFLPADKRALLKLALRVTAALDTAEERRLAVAYGVTMLADGRVTVAEWARFGKILGIFKPNAEGNK